MIIGFSRYSGESGSGPVLDYLTGYLVNGERRDPKPEVIRGDADAVARLIDSIPFQRRYSSGVCSFAPSDQVTPEAREDIMNRFENALFAGLEGDRRSIVWVRHRDKGREEMHFLAVRIDLGTRKSLNIAPPTPQSRQLIDSLRESINLRYGFRDPSDPECRQGVSLPAHVAKLAAQAKRLGRSPRADIRQVVTAQLMEKVQAGLISSRTDVLSALRGQGFEVSRAGADYLTIVCPESGERVRLKGGVFRQYFRPEDLRVTTAHRDPARLLSVERRLERLVEKRAAYHRSRYALPEENARSFRFINETAHDRTRNSPATNSPTRGVTPARTRTAIWSNLERLKQTTEYFSNASRSLEHAGQRLGDSSRTFTRDFNQAISYLSPRSRFDPTPPRQVARQTPTLQSPRHERDADMELELEL